MEITEQIAQIAVLVIVAGSFALGFIAIYRAVKKRKLQEKCKRSVHYLKLFLKHLVNDTEKTLYLHTMICFNVMFCLIILFALLILYSYT